MIKKSIIITSIFPPTKAVLAFSRMDEYSTIVVGDRKSPLSYSVPGVRFLSVNEQPELGFSMNDGLPYNHYGRKNLGYLYAIEDGAEIIIDTDDDNIPYEGWSFPLFSGTFDTLEKDLGFINIYDFFTEQKIWPRGLPLNKIRSGSNGHQLAQKTSKIGIWQGLADGDPDVDAIYRLLFDVPCHFKKRSPVVLGKNTMTPLNSQNTAFRKELFPLLYLPSTVTFRFTDILRGFVAQPIMWLYDYSVGIAEANVFQERNPHDYMKDFRSEIPCFVHGEEIIELVSEKISSSFTVSENLLIAYENLYEKNMVQKEEIGLLNCWIRDIEKVCGQKS